MSALLYFFGGRLYFLFINDPVVLHKGEMILKFFAPTYITYVCIEILSGALRGVGDSVIPTLMTCAGVCVLRTLWNFVMLPRYPRLETVMISYPISWVLTSVLFILYYLRFSRMRKLREQDR